VPLGDRARVSRVGQAQALATTVTLMFRPVARPVRLMADRYGRLPLMLDLIFYSIVEVLSGLAPTTPRYGAARAVRIGMRGSGRGASLATGKSPPRLRDCSVDPATGLRDGLTCWRRSATSSCTTIGLRPLFFIGGLPALLAVFVRMRSEGERGLGEASMSLARLGRAIAGNWKSSSKSWLHDGDEFAFAWDAGHVPLFLERDWHFGVTGRAGVTACSMVGAIIGGTLVVGFRIGGPAVAR